MALRINLWSCPRNVSTAFMYSWAQRADTRVYDEPLYAHYLRISKVNHPGGKKVLETMEQDGEKVVQELILGNESAPVLFFKQMTHHLIGLDEGFIPHTKNILFIRNPKEIIASYAKVIEHPTMDDVGVQAQYDLWERWGEKGAIHAVLDSKYLLKNPADVIQKLCEKLEIPFDPSVLDWEAGPRAEDGCWAPYWYANVHRSTGFRPYRKTTAQLPEHLESLAADCQPYYDFLTEKSIR